MRPWLAVLVTAWLALTGCTGDEPADGQPGGASSNPDGGVLPTSTAPPIEHVQQVLDDARLTEQQLGMAADESYRRESGLQTPTFAYCGDHADPVDQLRLARTQRWWKNDAWPWPDEGGYTVGVEIVYYEPGGVEQTMEAFGQVPERCPEAHYASGTTATFAATQLPASFPAGAVALEDEWTYPEGAKAPGLIVAIPAGDVLGFLYIRGHEATVHQRADELARRLAGNVAEADALIKELRP
ncbi:hypothetical protein [Phytoactinopolyspora mesophila]|uniref:Sensor domain-containing protein n=1 Tax=Phytoactinopolyspora mesophila TaxID=2650750 RepID=A0A7K3LWZ0_9ACTN|nr:hypothetical protein [Phytoactinopolyspora mesophila]NDL55531.1 hypothetical protein [Phytoactinopolyspora mesophila]